MPLLLKNAMVCQDGEFRKSDILINGDIIEKIDMNIMPDVQMQVYDLTGKYAVPGYLDIHTHGGFGVDVNSASAEDLEKLSCFFASHGTTSWLCSILTDTEENTLRCIREVRRWKSLPHHGADLMGIHLEGPFLSEEYCGAMPRQLLQEADADLIRKYQTEAEGMIRYITVAPEVKGVIDIIPELVKMGITVAIGHSGAGYDIARKAIERGVLSGTHVGNAMRTFDRHDPAIWGALLEDDHVYAEAICDGKHLHPGSVRLYLKLKTNKKLVAVTDSIMATGLPDGDYRLGADNITVTNGDAKVRGTDIRAGSTLTTDQALKNIMKMTGKPLEYVIPCLTENPAKLIKVDKQTGTLKSGMKADINVVDRDGTLIKTWCAGRLFTG